MGNCGCDHCDCEEDDKEEACECDENCDCAHEDRSTEEKVEAMKKDLDDLGLGVRVEGMESSEIKMPE